VMLCDLLIAGLRQSIHKPHLELKYLLEILGNNISSDQTPDEINSLGNLR